MANRCYTTYKIKGEVESVKNLWNWLEEKEANVKDVWLDELADHYGVDYQNRHIHVRGKIYFAEYDEEENVLTMETDTAWSACTELFLAIRRAEKGALSISYREMEPGQLLFFVHDEGGFFPEECCVYSGDGPFEDMSGELFDTVGMAIDYWCERVGEKRGDASEEEMLERIEGYEYADEYAYFSIYKFEEENEG